MFGKSVCLKRFLYVPLFDGEDAAATTTEESSFPAAHAATAAPVATTNAELPCAAPAASAASTNDGIAAPLENLMRGAMRGERCFRGDGQRGL